MVSWECGGRGGVSWECGGGGGGGVSVRLEPSDDNPHRGAMMIIR